jgi:hypothetical protein
VKNNWFEAWIVTPLLEPPMMIADPFTFYCCVLGNDGSHGLAADDGEAIDAVESSDE